MSCPFSEQIDQVVWVVEGRAVCVVCVCVRAVCVVVLGEDWVVEEMAEYFDE